MVPPGFSPAAVKGRGQRLAQCGVHEVAADMGIDRGRGIAAMPHCLLDEPPVHPVFGQVSHPRVPQAVRCQGLRQSQRIAVDDEPGVDLGWLDPRRPLGQPPRG